MTPFLNPSFLNYEQEDEIDEQALLTVAETPSRLSGHPRRRNSGRRKHLRSPKGNARRAMSQQMVELETGRAGTAAQSSSSPTGLGVLNCGNGKGKRKKRGKGSEQA